MPEQTKSFMVELDLWSEANVVGPLISLDPQDPDDKYEEVTAQVKKAIRTKVLESYRNGQSAGPRKAPVSRRRYGV